MENLHTKVTYHEFVVILDQEEYLPKLPSEEPAL